MAQYRGVTYRPSSGLDLGALVAARARTLPALYATRELERQRSEELKADTEKFNKTYEISQEQNKMLADKLKEDARASQEQADIMKEELGSSKIQNLASNILGVGSLGVSGYSALKNKELLDLLRAKEKLPNNLPAGATLSPSGGLDLNPQYREGNFTGFFSDSGDDIVALEESAAEQLAGAPAVGAPTPGQAPPGGGAPPSGAETGVPGKEATLEPTSSIPTPVVSGGIAGLARFGAGQLSGERFETSAGHGVAAGVGAGTGAFLGSLTGPAAPVAVPVFSTVGAYLGDKAGGKVEEWGRGMYDTGETAYQDIRKILESAAHPEDMPAAVTDAGKDIVQGAINLGEQVVSAPEKIWHSISSYGCIVFSTFHGKNSEEAKNAKEFCAKFMTVPKLLGYYTLGYEIVKFAKRWVKTRPYVKKYFADPLAQYVRYRLNKISKATLGQRILANVFLFACEWAFNLVHKPYIPKGATECISAALKNTEVKDRFAHILAEC